jgi:hypothetical protein
VDRALQRHRRPDRANGLRLEFTRLDGSNFFTFFVRDET